MSKINNDICNSNIKFNIKHEPSKMSDNDSSHNNQIIACSLNDENNF